MIDSFYLVTLGSYRAFYLLNWIVRYFGVEHHFEPIATIFGIIQTAFYVDFAWVYWSRQRVKLRNGGVVDSDDLSRGWLISNLAGRAETDEAEAEDRMPNNNQQIPSVPSGGKWGVRGISVSADDTLADAGTR